MYFCAFYETSTMTMQENNQNHLSRTDISRQVISMWKLLLSTMLNIMTTEKALCAISQSLLMWVQEAIEVKDK